jgi:glycosyltransferase involved in cell wall biosynthesis
MLWIRPSVKHLSRFLSAEPVDAIITTGPPHSLHLIGYHLHQRTGIPWLADFRDPWTRIDFYSELKLTRLADWYHHRLEAKVLRTADRVIAIGDDMMKEFKAKGARRVEIITNGYDEEDIPKGNMQPDGKFSILHLGTFSRTRNSTALWSALGKLAAENPKFAHDLEIRLIGNVDFSVLQSIEENGLGKCLVHIAYMSHTEAMKEEGNARVLLLMINNSKNSKGILTGKFFEYLASRRPILLIGPTDGDAAGILEETESGIAADFDDEAAIIKTIQDYYERFTGGEFMLEAKNIEKYSRRNLTGMLAGVLNKLTATSVE